jgi:hypothetical protein
MLLSCPTCDASLEVPDGFTGQVRCPTCQAVFSLAPASGGLAAGAAGHAGRPSSNPGPPKPPPVAAFAPPPPAPARYHDKDDDRPRRRDEDDEDDRPRRKPRRDEDYDDRPENDPKAGFAAARTGALLLAISLWMYLGVLGLLTLLVLIAWAGGSVPSALMVLTGLIGLGSWIVAGVGMGFNVAGPARTRGLAIAAVSVGGVHLVLTFISFGQLASGPVIDHRSGSDLAAADSSVAWLVMSTTLWMLDLTLPVLIVASRVFGDVVVASLAGGCELARLILILLTFQAQAEAAKAYGVASKARLAVTVVAIVCGAAVVIAALVAVIIESGKLYSRTGANLAGATMFLILLGHTLMLILPGTVAHGIRDALARKAR